MNRKTLCAFLALATCVELVGNASAAFMNGNVVVTRVGTGAAALSSAATAAFLDEYDSMTASQVAPIQTLALPTADSGLNATLTVSGTSTSEGFLTLSTNRKYLTVTGYDAAPGTAGVVGATAATVNRVVGVVNVGTMGIDTTTALNNAHSTSNIRSAVTTNGTDIWTGGTGSSGTGLAPGVTYTTLGATTATRINTSGASGTNRRVVNIFNGQLYVSGMTTGGPNQSVNTVGTGLPTAPTAEANIPGLPTAAGASIYDFWFKDVNTLYLASDSDAATGGGIQKWTESGGTWSLAYILLNNGTTTTATRGLAGAVDGTGTATLWATTGSNLIKVVDTGAAATATILATAATNTAFRGVELIIPEPASLALVALGGFTLLGLFRRRR